MHDERMQLRLTVNPRPITDEEELARLCRRLRREIHDLDVERVDWLVAAEHPVGAKAGDPVTWGTLLVALMASEGVFTTLIDLLKSWLVRNEQRSITLELDGDKLEVTGLSSAEQQQLIGEWMTRHKLILSPND